MDEVKSIKKMFVFDTISFKYTQAIQELQNAQCALYHIFWDMRIYGSMTLLFVH